MRRLILGLLVVTAAHASDGLLLRLQDVKATAAQRNDACYALRGNRSEEVITALRNLMADGAVRACAARNLRETGAVDALLDALASNDADARIAAARELGALRDPRAIDPLSRAAEDANVLVAASALDALVAYGNVSYLLPVARQPGVAGVMALERAARFHDRALLPIARRILDTGDVAAQVIALSVIADLGDASDLPRLRELAAKSEPVASRGRGFGLMPVIDVSRVAKNAIAAIER